MAREDRDSQYGGGGYRSEDNRSDRGQRYGGKGKDAREQTRAGQYTSQTAKNLAAGVGLGGIGTLADPKEKMDYFGSTVFGPSRKYTGSFLDNILGGGYRAVQSYAPDQFQSRFSQMGGLGKGILGGLMSLINPVAGLAYRGINKLGALKDYGTLADYAKGEFGLFQDEDVVDTIDIRDKFNRMGIMNPNLITPQPKPGINLNDYMGLEDRFNVPSAAPEDYDFTGFEDAMAFNPGSIKDRALKQQFNIYNATGIVTPNMQKLMQEDIEQNQKKGTPLSLPTEAYSLIG